MINKKVLKKRKAGIGLWIAQTAIAILFFCMLRRLNILELPYLLAAGAVLLLLDGYTIFTQFSRRFHIPGKVIAFVLCIILAAGSIYLYKAYKALDDVTGREYQLDEVAVVVLAGSQAECLDDLGVGTFGIQSKVDRENTDLVIGDINEKLKAEIRIKIYDDVHLLVQGLYDGEADAVIINEAFREMIVEEYSDFNEATRVVDSYKKETELNIPVREPVQAANITEQPFLVYISGIDTFGEISKTSRSDVNIVVAVNPVSKQILLVNTPRDYYVPLPVSDGLPDKLTHAGLYGVDCSLQTLEMLYDVDISYYIKVNFSGFKDIIDALGGVTVHSDYNFRSHWGPSFVKGDNQVNGEEALAFARERKSFSSGDIQRGKNQQYLIKAVFEKAVSPAVLTGYSSLIESVSNSIKTNMSAKDITDLIKMQLKDMASWNLAMIHVSGEGASKTTYSMPSRKTYVMLPDSGKTDAAALMISRVMEGQRVTEEEYEQLSGKK